jgi:hypothetical protein
MELLIWTTLQGIHKQIGMLESLLLIEEMVGATTPALVIYDFKFCSKGELQIAWHCTKRSYLWMSADGKAAPNHHNSDHPRWSTVI